MQLSTLQAVACTDFVSWRQAARTLLRQEIPPERVIWSNESTLIAPTEAIEKSDADPAGRVPKEFLEIAADVACHRDPERWPLLYRVLWRLTHGERSLLSISVDDDVYRMQMMEKAVRRDAHKMTAFVRFRKVQTPEGGEHYIAWHRPDHFIVRRTSGFFKSRFGIMRWTILTPDGSVSWDGKELTFGPGVPKSQAPQPDELEKLWLTYYGATFNPARIKLKMMRREMPVRHWATLPETQIIDDLLREAPKRVEEMMKKAACPTTTSAADFLPEHRDLTSLSHAAAKCQGCQIYCNATQTVFGQGPAHAPCMFIGEQPGDQEDLAGQPFIGPAGSLLNQVLEEVGIDRSLVYVTNAVKHFKFEPRGKRRIHAKPSAREVAACRPWLEAEIHALKPKMIVCLGATAAQTLMGAGFRLTHHRGEAQLDTPWAPWLLATVHPSSLLRLPDPQARIEGRAKFAEDLTMVAREIQKL